MEILDSESPNVNWHFRSFIYFLYTLVLGGCLLWNTFGQATLFRLPFNIGCSGGCHVESPFVVGFGVMGILFYSILFFQKKTLS